MALTQLTYENKETLVNQPDIEAKNKVTAGDMNEIKTVVNGACTQVDTNENAITALQTAITNMQTITEGTGTPNSSYVGAVENNKWTRIGSVVTFSFTLTTNNTIDYTTTLFSGLPKAKSDMRFMGLWTNNNWPLRLAITDNGEIKNAYSTSNPTSGQTVEACVVYITKD